MSNFLYQPYVAGTQSAVTAPLYGPRHERANRPRFRREAVPYLARANSFYASNGATPSRGWVLLRRADLNALNLFAANLQLHLSGFIAGVPELVLYNLSVVQARCVSAGLKGDKDAVYLVELCDGQGLLYSPWFSFPLEASYNVRAPAYPTSSVSDPAGFYTQSLSGGATAWTWSTLVQDLWNRMSFALGTFTSLPVTPAGTPENFSYPGGSCWEALVQVLDLLGCTVATDLTNQNVPYSVVQYGAADAAFAAQVTKYANLLEDDLDYVDGGAGRVPGQYTVYFQRRNRLYGTEETVRRDNLQWTTTPSYAVTVTATQAGYSQFAKAAGQAFLWDDFSVRFDEDGNALAADVTTAQALAVERATQAYNRTFRGTLGYLRRDYAGALPFATGSQVDGVRWHMTHEAGRLAWRTTVTRGHSPAFDELAWENR